MDERKPRLIRKGVPQKVGTSRVAVILVLLLLTSILTPVQADVSVARDDFGILGELADTLEKRANSGEAIVAREGGITSLAYVDGAARDIQAGDALSVAESYLDGVTMRDAEPFTPDHPRPYDYIMDASTHPDSWPYNLVDTLISVDSWQLTDPLAIGLNTYAIYVNYSARNNGPQYEAWDSGTFTGELFVGTDLVLFENYIDIDGDGSDDLSVGLTIQGLTTMGEGWGIETSGGLLPIPTELWLSPTFEWRVNAINLNDPLWDSLGRLEVSLMKGLAFDITLDDSESYAIVLDTSFTQPPHEFTVGVGIEKITFDIQGTFNSVLEMAASLLIGGVNSTDLALTSITAPYAIKINNPNAVGDDKQTNCEDDSYYDPIVDYAAESKEHKCGFGIGVGFIRFGQVQQDQSVPIKEVAYIDTGFHPEVGETEIPEEVDLTLRNDNAGDNTFDTVEIYSDKGADVYMHYYEDRSNVPEGNLPFGNITDSRAWIRGLPSGSMHDDEIAAIFTMIGEAPGSINLPGEIPERLSMIIAIKNFTGDATTNVNDDTLPVNPAQPPNTLIAIAATESIDSISYKSTFMRGGYAVDSSSLQIEVENLPPVIVVSGSFLIPSSGVDRVTFDNPDLNSISQILDNALLTIVEIVLDVGSIVNGLPDSIVGTAGSSGGEVDVACYNQVKRALPNSQRQLVEVGSLALALSSSDQPWLADTDHILLSQDTNLDVVDGRIGPQDPLVPVAFSVRIGGISHVHHSFDPVNEVRKMMLEGSEGGPLLIGHIKHEGTDLESGVKQSATVSNRPADFYVEQTPDKLTYSASTPIGTITYGGQAGDQKNAMRLAGLPSEFSIVLGDTLGYEADLPMDSIQIQMSNASTAKTMDGDHMRFWVDEDSGEASFSAQISNVTKLRRLSPLDPGSSGPEGNSRYEMIRTSSGEFNVLFEDESTYDDPFLGTNGKIRLDPLPANITVAFPSDIDSSGLALPDFSEGEGVESLAFFLGDLVDVGQLVNGVVHGVSQDLWGTSGDTGDLSLGLNLVTGEAFDIAVDIRKGSNVQAEPDWAHGITMEVNEKTVVNFNLSRMPTYTLSSREVVDAALSDGLIHRSEYDAVVSAWKAANFSGADELASALEDGLVLEDELEGLNLTKWEEEGVTITDRRAWHLRSWIPSLPAGKIVMEYDFRMVGEIPTYEFDLELDQWTAAREELWLSINGLQNRDISLVVDGLDTLRAHNVKANAVFTTQDNLTVPRFNIDMHYDLGARLNSAHAMMIDRNTKSRVEALIIGVPQSTDFSATIGDVLLLDLVVPHEYRVDDHSADSLMIQQMRYLDGTWWPATAFMRNLPGEMHLATEPQLEFDIRKQMAFQGMMTLDYSSNTEDMDLYLEAEGRAIDSKGNILMLAEDLPSRFVMTPTEDWGMKISSSGDGVKRVYIRQTDVPSMPGVTIDRIEIVGQELKSATMHLYTGPLGYPVIVLDDITSGRLVASAQASVEPGYRYDIFGDLNLDGRAVLLDAQFTGIIPTASSLGVNGIVTDLSLIGTLTGGAVETRHILVVEPLTTLVASGLALLG